MTFYSLLGLVLELKLDFNDKADLHGVKEEEHDEEGDGGAEGEAHCLHTVQGRHTVLSPEKWNLYIDSQQNLFVFLYVRI